MTGTGSILDDVLTAVAALGLDSSAAFPTDEADPATIDALIDRARDEKLLGLLDQAVAADALVVPPAAAEEIGHRTEAVMAWCLLVERHALEVHARLDPRGIEHRFVKGLTSAHRFHAHPALRTFVDVDVLVRGADLDRTTDLLLVDGHQRAHHEWKAGFAARWGKSVTLRCDDAVEVDLHRVLASGPYGLRTDGAELWARPADTVTLGGVALPCLDPAAAFVHACVHAVTGTRAHLSSLRDVAAILAHADDGGIAEVEAALRVEACVTEAVDLTWRRLRLDPDERADRLRNRPVSRRDRRWLDLYTSSDRSFRHLALAGIGAVRGLRGKAAYAWALARP